MKTSNPRVPPALVMALMLATLYLLRRVMSDGALVFPGQKALASGLVMAGGLVVLIGVGAFGRAGTTVDPLDPDKAESLVSRGIYGYSRNPMYVGFLLVVLAGVVRMGIWPGLLLPPLFVWYMNRFQIGPEEIALEHKFGQAYLDYKARVRRWL